MFHPGPAELIKDYYMTKPPTDRLPDPIDLETGRTALDDPDHPKEEVEEVNHKVLDELRKGDRG
jgi:hypothetical protein